MGSVNVFSSSSEKASDEEVKVYGDLYSSSVIRGMIFSKEIDPLETIREEIYLERKLSQMALDEGWSEDIPLMADIDYYQTKTLLETLALNNISVPTVEEKEIEDYYLQHKEEFIVPEKVSFIHIFFMVPKGSKEVVEKEKREKADQVYKKILRGMDFEKLAREYSDFKGIQETGGKVEGVIVKKLNPVFQDAMKDLKVDDVSQPFRTPYGWEIVKILSREEEKFVGLVEVKNSIRAKIEQEKSLPVQEALFQSVREEFPYKIEEELLKENLDPQSNQTLVTVGQISFSINQILNAINATHQFANVEDPSERIKKGLEAFIFTEQLKALAEKQGLFENKIIKTKFEFIHNRLLGEKFYKNYRTKRKPTDDELKAYQKEKIEAFSSQPLVKGKQFVWLIPDFESKSDSERNFQRESLRIKAEKLIDDFKNGKISLSDLEKTADTTYDLDWLRPGPSGVFADKAFFGAEPGHLSNLFEMKKGVSAAFIEEKKEAKPLPFSEVKDKVEYSLLNKWSLEDKENLLKDLLKEYALLP